MPPTLWFDVEDLLHYVGRNPRPSGIQRLTFEIYRALHRRHGGAGRVRFVRHASDGRTLLPVAWETLDAAFGTITDAAATAGPLRAPVTPAPVAPPPIIAEPAAPARSRLRALGARTAGRLPPRLRGPLVLFLVLQAQSVAALLRLAAGTARSAPRLGRRLARPALPAGHDPDTGRGDHGEAFARLARPGDSLVVLGSPWFHDDYAAIVRDARNRLGLRFAVLVHDLIPVRRPEWCHRGVVDSFRQWYGAVLPLCDAVFAISRATAADLERHAREAGLALPGPVRPIPLGTGFGPAADGPAAARPDLPAPGSYALFVSTIEARKNHALLFRAWRRLLDEMPPEQVPVLVFAGRVGWLVADLMQQLENANWLQGRIRFVRDPSDAELRALYQGCLFTLFPSLYEGWGLPVTESLALGKPCLASGRTAVPEAGGALARYFDPEDLGDATRVIREAIEDRAGLAAWEARVRREFRPVPWDDAAAAIVAGLDATA